jgi:prepilin-type N-terminal cleavage/methylation domain-containing protein
MRVPNQRGVTLIELIVVIVIIAIGAAFLAPNLGAWIHSYRLRGATREVVSVIRTAHMKAISNNRQYQVLFNPGGSSYVLQYQNSATFINEGDVQPLPPGIRISSITFPGNTAQFNPNSTSSTGGIVLENRKGQKRTITLTTATGRVDVN